MKSSEILFRSKVARRFFLLFIISSLIPVLILAVLSLHHVRSTSTEQILDRLKQDAKFYGLSIYDRLQVIEEELLIKVSLMETQTTDLVDSVRNSRHLVDWHIQQEEGNQLKLQDEDSGALVFTDSEKKHMKKGLSVLTSANQQSAPPELFMSRIVNINENDTRILSAHINPVYLWGDPDRFKENVSACVLDASFNYIHCSNSIVHPSGKLLQNTDGLPTNSEKTNVHIKDMLMGRWELFMQPNYFTSKWHILLYENQQAAFSQLKQFSGIYIIVIFLAILVVALFSIHMIRRNAIPLEVLMKGIRQLSENKFNTIVKVDSHDEYREVADAFNSMSRQIGNQINRLKTQAHVDQLILSRPSVEDIVEISIDGIRRLISCDQHELALRDNTHSGIFRLAGGDNTYNKDEASRYFTFDKEMIDLALQGKSILVADSHDKLRLQLRHLYDFDYNYYLLLPMVNVDALFGLFILSYKTKPSQDDIDNGVEFSNRIAVALANAAWEEKLYNQARYDLLTTLPNRASLEERLEQEISHASRFDECIAILFLDLDRFKNINDSLGHEFGDAVLKEISSRFRKDLREEDIVARLGGDEFVVMLRGLEDSEEAVTSASAVAEKIIHLITRPIILDDHEIRITTSIGISIYPADAVNMNTLLRNADSAMYHAKDMGRGNFQFYSEELHAAANYRLEIETKLHRAVEQNEFELYYQPKFDSKTQTIIGGEALIRWIDEDGSAIEPAKFIAVAEDIGLTTIIGEWALKVACKQASEWLLPISVNISARHFHHGNLIDHVKAALHEANLDPQLLEVEITETTTMHNLEKTVSVLRSLKKVGIKISIDDFGTGYSSLNYLKHFPVDKLKIDRVFIKNILLLEKDLAIVKSTVSLAHNLGLNVVAEGVEFEEQRETLEVLGCDEIQGFLYSQALPAKEFIQYFKQNICSRT
ncbi:MAG: EAL domain-containing protein [Arenicellales bacterium]